MLQVVSRHLWCTSRLGPPTDVVSFIHRRLVDAHNLQVQLYADDTQVYGFCDIHGILKTC